MPSVAGALFLGLELEESYWYTMVPLLESILVKLGKPKRGGKNWMRILMLGGCISLDTWYPRLHW